MKRVLQVLVVLVVVLAGAYYVLVDGVLRKVIEHQGSQALKAELDVGSVNFHLFPLAITLRNVQATNPSQPDHNLLEAASISSSFTIGQVLDHKIIADDVQLHGLRFNQKRARSGAIPGLTPPPSPKTLGGGLPGLSLPDTKTLLATEKAKVQGQLQQVQQNLTQLRDGWQSKLKTLPDQSKIDSYRERAQKLREGSILERVSGARQLRQDIQSDLDRVRQLRAEAKTDMQQAQDQLAAARALPQRDLDQLLANAGLGSGELGHLTQALVGGDMASLVAQLKGLAGLPQGNAGAAPAPAAAGGASAWQVLARKVTLDGRVDIGATPLRFQGVIHDVTPQPKLWDVVTRFALQAAPGQAGQFKLDGLLDQRRMLAAEAKLALSQFPVDQLPLSSSDAVGITLQKALLDSSGVFRLRGDTIDVNLTSLFKQANLAINASDNPIAQAVKTALQNVSDFNLDLDLSGSIASPKVNLRSNLDQVLGAAVGDQVRAQTAKLAAKLQGQLQQEVKPQLDAINQLGGDFQSMQQTLQGKESALQNLTNLRGLF